jgi:uncharacterized membrane protein YfcA
MTHDFIVYILAGFIAQIIDGALGMAYGITASSMLMGFGVPPAVVSSTVHAAECFTTGASAISHHAFGNISRHLFRRLLIPGIIGAALGAYVLSSVNGDFIKPYISGYLLIMGVIIIVKAFLPFPPREVTTKLTPLALIGSFLDAVGGGGWGPIVATNLIVRGNAFRETVGSVHHLFPQHRSRALAGDRWTRSRWRHCSTVWGLSDEESSPSSDDGGGGCLGDHPEPAHHAESHGI